jgi:hypothetical protein
MINLIFLYYIIVGMMFYLLGKTMDLFFEDELALFT